MQIPNGYCLTFFNTLTKTKQNYQVAYQWLVDISRLNITRSASMHTKTIHEHGKLRLSEVNDIFKKNLSTVWIVP